MNNQTLKRVKDYKSLNVGDFVTANSGYDRKTPVGIGRVEKKAGDLISVYFPFWKDGHDSQGLVSEPLGDEGGSSVRIPSRFVPRLEANW